MPRLPSNDRGSATVVLVCLLFLALVAAGAVFALARVAVTGAKATTSADLAALAAAARSSCDAAISTAAANEAELRDCHADGGDYVVAVETVVEVFPGRRIAIVAQARAGPP